MLVSGFLGAWRILFVGRWRPILCVCDVNTLIGFDTRPTKMGADTMRVSFGGSFDVVFQYDGNVYIATNCIIVSPRGLLLYVRRILLVCRWWEMFRAFDVERSIADDINYRRPA